MHMKVNNSRSGGIYLKSCTIAQSRGEKPQPNDSFVRNEQKRLQCRRSMIADSSTNTGLFGDLEDIVDDYKNNKGRSSSFSKISRSSIFFEAETKWMNANHDCSIDKSY